MNLSDDVQQKLVYDLFLVKKLDYDYKKVMNILDFIKIILIQNPAQGIHLQVIYGFLQIQNIFI